jgi:serine/threonine protein kinase
MDDRSGYVDEGPNAPSDLSGALVDNKYQVVRPLGHGSAGTVYLCWHITLDKQIALKVLHPELAGNPGMVARFQREAQAAARLQHPNSVHVMDFGQDPANGQLYLAMEYVEARDLSQVLTHDWPLSDARVVGIMSQVLSALSAAHALGIVHRDLKPENILVRPTTESDASANEDHVLVCDFGIAQLSPIRLSGSPIASSARLQRVTGQGMVVGTPSYMSPEQARAEAQDARSDIYSAGVVLFQLLTRTLPFMAPTPLSVAVMHCTTPPPPPSGYGPVNSALEAACLKALSKTPEARFQTAREMQAALQAALSQQAVGGALARRISAVPPTRKQAPRADVRHPSLAPAERVVALDIVPKHHWAPLVIGGLVLTIVGLGWLPRFLANDAEPVAVEQVRELQPSAADQVPQTKPMQLADRAAVAEPAGKLLPASTTRAALPTPAQPALPNNALATASVTRHVSRHHDGERVNSNAAKSTALQEAYSSNAPAVLVAVPEQSNPSVKAILQESVAEVSERLITNPIDLAANLPANLPANPLPAGPSANESSVSSAAEPAAAIAAAAPALPVPVQPLTPPPSAASIARPAAPAASGEHVDPERARVAIRDAFTRAAVSRVAILNAINQVAVSGCYQKALRNGAGPTRVLDARLDFSTNMGGRIVFASVHGSEIPKSLRDCIERVTRQGRLREADTGEAQASVTLTFNPR